MPLGLRRMDFESRWRRSAPSTAETPRPAATSLNVSPVSARTGSVSARLLDPAQDHVAVRRRDLAAVARAAQHVGCGHRGSAPEKRIEDYIAGIGERFHEELDQRAWEWRRVRSLAALRLHLDYVAGARCSPMSSCRRHRHRAFLPHLRARRSPGARSRSSISDCRASSRSSPPTRDSPPPRGT